MMREMTEPLCENMVSLESGAVRDRQELVVVNGLNLLYLPPLAMVSP